MQHKTDTRLAAFVAAFASLGAGIIHLAVTPDHWQEWIPAGVFFIGIGLFQIFWAGAVLRFPFSGLASMAVVANLGSMALWAASRVWGLPAGPNAGMPLAVGVPGVLTVVLETVVVVSALWFLLPRERRVPVAGYRFALSGIALVVVSLTASGTVAALGHDHGGHGPGAGGQHSESGAGSDGEAGHEHPTTSPSGPSTSTPSTPAPVGPGGGHADDEHEH